MSSRFAQRWAAKGKGKEPLLPQNGAPPRKYGAADVSKARARRVWFHRGLNGDTIKLATLKQLTSLSTGIPSLKYLLTGIDPDVGSGDHTNKAEASGIEGKPHRKDSSSSGIRGNTGAWWLDIEAPSAEELDALAEAVGIHRLTRRDIESKEPRDKFQRFDNYLFVAFQGVDCSGSQAPTAKALFILVFPNWGTLSIHYGAKYTSEAVVERMKSLDDVDLDADWIAAVVIDTVVDSFAQLTNEMSHSIPSVEDGSKLADMLRSLDRITAFHNQVIGLSLLGFKGSKEGIVKELFSEWNCGSDVIEAETLGFYKSNLLVDIQDKITRIRDKLQSLDRTLPLSADRVSLRKSELTNRKLTALTWVMAIAVAFLPLQVITGLWGMNVHVPGQDDPERDPKHDNFKPFFGILGALCVYALLSVGCIHLLVRHFDRNPSRN
ncbi:CorA metal ion transporter [Tulasnella sp. 419]|nr:CorA metal ion transporter [Tulasnella sp. 419]